jgi:hypothetical protein
MAGRSDNSTSWWSAGSVGRVADGTAGSEVRGVASVDIAVILTPANGGHQPLAHDPHGVCCRDRSGPDVVTGEDPVE